jgi:hypothetical protein
MPTNELRRVPEHYYHVSANNTLESLTQNDAILGDIQSSSTRSRPSVGVKDRLVISSVLKAPALSALMVAKDRGSSMMHADVVFGSPQKLSAPSDDRKSAFAGLFLDIGPDAAALGDGGGGGGGAAGGDESPPLSQNTAALDACVKDNYTYPDVERLVPVYAIVVAGKQPDAPQANICTFGPDSIEVYNEAMDELEALRARASEINDNKLATKLGRLMTEDFHSSIGMFAMLRVVVALASTFIRNYCLQSVAIPCK